MKNKSTSIISDEIIENKIFIIRGKKVMFDRDLAILYGVRTKELNKAVSRNKNRFPADFMFQLNKKEFDIWMSQVVISNEDKLESLRFQIGTSNRGGTRYMPYVFTEQGVAMLSSVLKSERAVQVNIQIMRTFTKIREMIISNKELRLKIESMEKKYDNKFHEVFDAIKRILITQVRDNSESTNRIGFKD